MSDMNENEEVFDFEGGLFEEAGVNVADIPNDPFGFGNEFWPIVVLEVGPIKVTKNGDKLGQMVKFAVDHPDYATHYVGTKGLGNGTWYRLPVPLKLRDRIPYDPNGADEKKDNHKIGLLYGALGFPKDQWAKLNLSKLVGKRMMAKIKPVMEDGYYKFNINAMKTLEEGADSGWSGNGGGGTSASSAKSEAEKAREALAREMGE